ncbi:MAG TPA: hypothetical protein VIL32_08820, partial [Steroidobacteraceae bacterium]
MSRPAVAVKASEGEPARQTQRPAPAAPSSTGRSLQRLFSVFTVIGVGFIVPVVRLCRGESPRANVRELGQSLGVPLISILVFLFLWGRLSEGIETSLGQIPGPAAVWEQVGALWADHKAERAKAAAFYERQERRNAERLAEDPTYQPTIRKYTGKP